MFRSRRNNNRNGRFRSRKPFGGKKKDRYTISKSGPAECTVAALEDHYFDCSGYNEADRYISTKKAIIQYMGRKYGGDIRVTLESGKRLRFPAPPNPADNYIDFVDGDGNAITAESQITLQEREDYKEELKDFSKRKRELQKNMEIAYSIVYGQCSYFLQQKLENNAKWANIRDTQSVLDLLELIKILSFKFEDEKYLPLSIHNAKSVYYSFNQGNLSLNDYREKYMNVVEIATSYDNQLHDEALSKQVCQEQHGHKDLATLTVDEKEAVDEEAHQKYIACGFLLQANENKYGHVTADLENDYMKGDNNYPKNMPEAYKYLDEYNTGNSKRDSHSRPASQLAFMQGNSRDAEQSCFNCGRKNCTVRTCPVCSKFNRSAGYPARPAYPKGGPGRGAQGRGGPGRGGPARGFSPARGSGRGGPQAGKKTRKGQNFAQTSGNRPPRRPETQRHEMGFVLLGGTTGAGSARDVEMPDYNFATCTEESLAKKPAEKADLFTHEECVLEYNPGVYNIVFHRRAGQTFCYFWWKGY